MCDRPDHQIRAISHKSPGARDRHLLSGHQSFDRFRGFFRQTLTEGCAPQAIEKRAVTYFNTNPYFAGLAVGAVARAECDEMDGAQIDRLRSALRGSLGAFGDRFIWTGVLPVASAAGLAIAVMTTSWWGVVAFLVLFNVASLGLRLWSIPVGWSLGKSVAKALDNPVLRGSGRVLEPASKVALGFAIPLVVDHLVTSLVPNQWTAVLLIGTVAFAVLAWLMPTIGGARLAFLILVLAAIMEWLWM